MILCCDRCKNKTASHRVSMFNAEMICRDCQQLEINHPQFEKAREAVLDSISRGDYEFHGIGLPDNLKQTVDKTLGAKNG